MVIIFQGMSKSLHRHETFFALFLIAFIAFIACRIYCCLVAEWCSSLALLYYTFQGLLRTCFEIEVFVCFRSFLRMSLVDKRRLVHECEISTRVKQILLSNMKEMFFAKIGPPCFKNTNSS